MVEIHLLDRLSHLAPRKRWLVGMTLAAGGRYLRAALVGVEGHGLAARVEVFACSRAVLPRALRRKLRGRRRRRFSGATAAVVAAQLAERQAILLDELAAEIAPVWDRVLAVAIDDVGALGRVRGLGCCLLLSGAARLAELSGQNCIDAFAARDLAQDGRGRPLLPLPHWMLLHDLQKPRALLECDRRARLTYLPASRDASAAARVWQLTLAHPNAPVDSAASLARFLADAVAVQWPQLPRVEELLVAGPKSCVGPLIAALGRQLAEVRVLPVETVGPPSFALRPAAVALLGLLHLDQVPANLTATTGTLVPRVLGRLTPGSLSSWQRLLRELAAQRPSVISLRSAM